MNPHKGQWSLFLRPEMTSAAVEMRGSAKEAIGSQRPHEQEAGCERTWQVIRGALLVISKLCPVFNDPWLCDL
jgi:hypothetical protein